MGSTNSRETRESVSGGNRAGEKPTNTGGSREHFGESVRISSATTTTIRDSLAQDLPADNDANDSEATAPSDFVLNIKTILRSSTLTNQFRHFLASSQFNVSDFDFFVEVDNFKRKTRSGEFLGQPEMIRKFARKIYDNHISENAPYLIDGGPMREQWRTDILQALQLPCDQIPSYEHIFADTVRSVFSDISSLAVPAFAKSEQYLEHCKSIVEMKNITAENLLDNAPLRLSFYEYLKNANSHELLDFFLEVENFRVACMSSENPCVDIAHEIFDKYIAQNSEHDIGASSTIRDNITKRLYPSTNNVHEMDGTDSDWCTDVFDEIDRDVIDQITIDLLPGFLKTEKYKQFVAMRPNSESNSSKSTVNSLL